MRNTHVGLAIYGKDPEGKEVGEKKEERKREREGEAERTDACTCTGQRHPELNASLFIDHFNVLFLKL